MIPGKSAFRNRLIGVHERREWIPAFSPQFIDKNITLSMNKERLN
jgi:hypothetical protein